MPGRMSPGPYYAGNPVKINIDFVDDDGLAYNPTTVTFKLMSPCRSQSSYVYGTDSEVARPSTGRYECTFPADVITEGGRWTWRVETTGPASANQNDFIIQHTVFNDDECCDAYRSCC